jgi:tetratricopeptide (TPR) repeat protein
LQVSECLEKAGEFQRASRLQSQLLSDSVSTLGADNPVTMSLRNSLAKSLIGQNGRDFERAELLLNDNIAAAERLNETKLIVRAKVALAAARADRGMYEEAVKDFVSIMEDLPKDLDVFERIRVRSELAHVLIECGDEKLSEQVLKASAADVADTDGVRAIAVKASLAFGIAKVFAFENPDKARESLAEPPGLEVIPSSNLRQLALILSQSVNDNDESWDRHIELTIKEHQQKFGQSEPIVDAQLTVSIAMRLLKKGEIEQGRALLEKVKVNLDSLHHNNGMLYAVVLELLAKHLEPGDARASAYEEKANEIRQSADRAIEAWKKSGADED